MNDWRQDPFFMRPLTRHKTSAGSVELPIRYYDNSNVVALFKVPMAPARELVAPAGLEPVTISRRHVLVAVAFYDYRQVSIAAYREVGVAIAVVPAGCPPPRFPLMALYRRLDHRMLGFYIVDLPVTTDQACAAGRELWGYPKFVTPIDFAVDGLRLRLTVCAPDQIDGPALVSLEGRAGPGSPAPQIEPLLYSLLDGQLLRTAVNTRGAGRIGLPGSLRLRVSDSTHPMAVRLRQLGLAGARPWMVFRSRRLQLRLNAGVALDY